VTPLFDLTGRVALVTGGSRGLGKAMARAFAEAGADVVICSRDEAELKSATREICDGTGARCGYVVADMAERPQAERAAREAIECFGRVDILVNNAGSNAPQPIDAIADETWDRLVELNLTAGMVLCRALVPGMKARGWGRIIHISSIMGLASKEGRHVYSATKAGLIGMARAGAVELGPHGITVNCIAPGPFLTDLNLSGLTEQQRAVFTERTALGRWGDPRELAGPALLLASPAGSYITGATLVVDGGVLCKTF
jgi:NAD(P)-dependent dehydrogenase (short-subunit alcohol dehydrogenase family)